MGKKIISIIAEVLLYFIIVFIISVVFKKIGWLDTSISVSAISLTIGWGIWRIISYFIKKQKLLKNINED